MLEPVAANTLDVIDVLTMIDGDTVCDIVVDAVAVADDETDLDELVDAPSEKDGVWLAVCVGVSEGAEIPKIPKLSIRAVDDAIPAESIEIRQQKEARCEAFAGRMPVVVYPELKPAVSVLLGTG